MHVSGESPCKIGSLSVIADFGGLKLPDAVVAVRTDGSLKPARPQTLFSDDFDRDRFLGCSLRIGEGDNAGFSLFFGVLIPETQTGPP